MGFFLLPKEYMTRILKHDYTSGKEVITDISNELVTVIFSPRKKTKFVFKIQRRDIPLLIKTLQKDENTNTYFAID